MPPRRAYKLAATLVRWRLTDRLLSLTGGTYDLAAALIWSAAPARGRVLSWAWQRVWARQRIVRSVKENFNYPEAAVVLRRKLAGYLCACPESLSRTGSPLVR
jgi:hypothetical protein